MLDCVGKCNVAHSQNQARIRVALRLSTITLRPLVEKKTNPFTLLRYMQTSFLINNGIPAALVLGLVAVASAVALIFKVRSAPTGTDLMREIAAAVQEGAAALPVAADQDDQRDRGGAAGPDRDFQGYLCRLGHGHRDGPGFLIGAVCSLAGGLHRHARGSDHEHPHGAGATTGAIPAMRVAFNGGAVTGLLVVGLGADRGGRLLPGRGLLFRRCDAQEGAGCDHRPGAGRVR